MNQPRSHDCGSIRLTFIANYVRGTPVVYETQSLHDALLEDVDKHFSSEGPERWAFCMVVDREGHEFTREEIVDQLEDIVKVERYRAHSAALREGER